MSRGWCDDDDDDDDDDYRASADDRRRRRRGWMAGEDVVVQQHEGMLDRACREADVGKGDKVVVRALPGEGRGEQRYNDGDGGGDGECTRRDGGLAMEDWRKFRAALVDREGVETMHHDRKKMSIVDLQCTEEYARRRKQAGNSTWSHVISHPEPGCLLVARRQDLGMFSLSVVLITEHDDAVGSSGLALNMPTQLYISNLGLEEKISNQFGSIPLYVGGPVHKNMLHVLHGRSDVEGGTKILEGVFAGGVESAAELVQQGVADAGEFRLLAGYSGWEPYQLAQEVEQGSWYIVSASANIILGCILGDYSKFMYQNSHQEVGLSRHDDRKLHCWRAILKETGLPLHLGP